MTTPDPQSPWWLRPDEDTTGPEPLRVPWWVVGAVVLGLVAFAAFFVYMGTVGVNG